MKTGPFALVALMLAGATASRAQTVIVSNIANSTAGVDSFRNAAAQQFITGPTDLQLSTVTTLLKGTTADTLTLELFSSDLDLPNVELSAIGTATPTTSASYSAVKVTAPTGIVLTANTPYWIVGLYNGADDWAYTTQTSSTGVGTIGRFTNSTTNGVIWNGPFLGEPYQLEIQGGNVIAGPDVRGVPEPGNIAAIIALGITSGLALRRRRRK